MKKFFTRYGHWVSLSIIGLSFFTTFIDFNGDTPDTIALVMGGIGFVAIGALAIVIEKHKRRREGNR